jgi:ATP-binding cassette subfamily B protein
MNGFGSHQELLADNAIYQAIYQGQTGGTDDAEEKNGKTAG